MYKCKQCDATFEKSSQIGYHVAFVHGTAQKGINIYLKEKRSLYEQNTKKCLNCKTDIKFRLRKNNFCNSSCAAIYNNKKRGKKVLKCLNCGTDFNPSTKKQKFCNHKCSGIYASNKLKKEWLATGIAGKYTGGKSGSAPKVGYVINTILEEQNNNCAICNNPNEWQGKKLVMILDHINGDCTDNKRENLRLICPNCNSQTDTFSGRNKGHGRKTKGFMQH